MMDSNQRRGNGGLKATIRARASENWQRASLTHTVIPIEDKSIAELKVQFRILIITWVYTIQANRIACITAGIFI